MQELLDLLSLLRQTTLCKGAVFLSETDRNVLDALCIRVERRIERRATYVEKALKRADELTRVVGHD